MKTVEQEPTPAHDCGLCDGPLVFDGWSDGWPDDARHATYICTDPDCGWWHVSADCCDQ